jgi:hypothetical protein
MLFLEAESAAYKTAINRLCNAFEHKIKNTLKRN